MKREKLSDLVGKKLAKMVDNKPTGFKLPSENELASKFSVSRSTIREAVSSLVAEGHITVKQGKGLFVKNDKKDLILGAKKVLVDKKKLQNAIIVANLLECSNIAEITTKITLSQIERLEANLKSFVDCTEKEVNEEKRMQKLVEIDHNFHYLLATFSQNNFLFAFLEYLFACIKDARKYFLGSAEREQRMIWEHRSIVEALAKGTGIAAKSLLKTHLENYLEYLKD